MPPVNINTACGYELDNIASTMFKMSRNYGESDSTLRARIVFLANQRAAYNGVDPRRPMVPRRGTVDTRDTSESTRVREQAWWRWVRSGRMVEGLSAALEFGVDVRLNTFDVSPMEPGAVFELTITRANEDAPWFGAALTDDEMVKAASYMKALTGPRWSLKTSDTSLPMRRAVEAWLTWCIQRSRRT